MYNPHQAVLHFFSLNFDLFDKYNYPGLFLFSLKSQGISYLPSMHRPYARQLVHRSATHLTGKNDKQLFIYSETVAVTTASTHLTPPQFFSKCKPTLKDSRRTTQITFQVGLFYDVTQLCHFYFRKYLLDFIFNKKKPTSNGANNIKEIK